MDFVVKLVFMDKLLQDKLYGHSHVFSPVHWCVEVKIANVDSHESSIGCSRVNIVVRVITAL